MVLMKKTFTIVRFTSLADANERSGIWTRRAGVSQLALLQHWKGPLTIYEWYCGLPDYAGHTSLPQQGLSQDASHSMLMQVVQIVNQSNPEADEH